MTIRLRSMVMGMALLILAVPASAEMNIGVIDLRQAVFSSDAAEEFGMLLQDELEEEERAIMGLQEEAQEMQQRLESDGAMMSEAEREGMEQELEQKVQEFQQRRGQFEQVVGQQQQQFLQQARPLVDAVMEDLLSEYDLDLILPAEAVIYVKPDRDYTEEMIERLNRHANE